MQALAAATALVESKLSSDLKKFLKKNIVKKELTDELAVADSKLGGIIKEKLDIQVCLPRRVPPSLSFHHTCIHAFTFPLVRCSV